MLASALLPAPACHCTGVLFVLFPRTLAYATCALPTWTCVSELPLLSPMISARAVFSVPVWFCETMLLSLAPSIVVVVTLPTPISCHWLISLPRLPCPMVAVAVLLSLYWSRSEEHTSELQSLMRISYAVFCLQ